MRPSQVAPSILPHPFNSQPENPQPEHLSNHRSLQPSRMETAAEVPVLIHPSAGIKKHGRVEFGKDGDEQKERRWRVFVPAVESGPRAMKVVATTTAGSQSSEDSSTTGSSTRSPTLQLRQQVRHLLTSEIDDGQVGGSRFRWAPVGTGLPSPASFHSINHNNHDRSSSRKPTVSPISPSRSMQEKQRRKRKSPCLNMGVFRSPLSRMVLSPRLHLWMMSPSSSQGTSTSAGMNRRQKGLGEVDLNVPVPICAEIDLNAEEQVNLSISLDNGQHVQDNVGDPATQVNLSIGLDDGQHVQDNVGDLATQVNLSIDLDNGQHVQDNVGAPAPQRKRRRKEVPDDIRKAIFEALLARSKSGCLVGNETKEVSTEFSVRIRTVQRIWKKGKSCMDQGIPVDVSSGKSKRGRKKKKLDLSKLRGMPILSRTTLDDVSKKLGVSKSTLHSMRREGIIERVSNSIKPLLTDNNKKERLKWCLSMLDPRSMPHDPTFKDLFDFVFVDEKWFYMTRKTERYYKAPDETHPTRTCKSKNFIPIIMFLTAFTRPRFCNGICTFDGKIRCFPFVYHEAAKRSSKNRKVGTMVMKPIDKIKQGVVREFLIDKVLPAIRAKWPREDLNKPIYIQQDNAPSHVPPNDKAFCEAAKQDGFDIRLICQPANSPDLNILDLGFFNAIQSIQRKTDAKTTEELVTAVDKAFHDYPPSKVDRIFLTLHGCLREVMKIDGGNGYNVPHLRKGMMERQGILPLQLKCEAALVEETISKLNE